MPLSRWNARVVTILPQRGVMINQACFDLAPLHNPANLEGILTCEVAFSDIPQAVIFDPALHATIPLQACLCDLPIRLCEEMKIRKYGFNGTSHRYSDSGPDHRLKRRPFILSPPSFRDFLASSLCSKDIDVVYQYLPGNRIVNDLDRTRGRCYPKNSKTRFRISIFFKMTSLHSF